MRLIDRTYFIGRISITQNAKIEEKINRIIDDTQKEILVKALGYDLYKQFMDGIDVVTPDQKWIDLRDGKDYTVEDEEGRNVTVRWNGLINSEKISLLAYFTYFNFMPHQVNGNYATGEYNANAENSNKSRQADVNSKMVNAYNMGIELYGKELEILSGRNALLRSPRYVDRVLKDGYRYDYFQEALKPSLYNFIYFANEQAPDTYTNWNFTPIEKINIFGI